MLFKLSIKNMKKSFKDYAIYFLTLVLGVAIFYMFNSLDSQEAMLQVSNSTRDIIKIMISMLGYVSVFVAVVLGLLIVYANNFLINRRKKEFGIYMTLGMGKWQISKIILFETILVGILSLIAVAFPSLSIKYKLGQTLTQCLQATQLSLSTYALIIYSFLVFV